MSPEIEETWVDAGEEDDSFGNDNADLAATDSSGQTAQEHDLAQETRRKHPSLEYYMDEAIF